MNANKLLIAIPTYNRHSFLVNSLLLLLPQLNENCSILIIDNNSTPSVSEHLRSVGILNSKISIIANRINIGGDANIMKCLSSCNDQWVWLLGDDDTVSANAVYTIQKTIDMLDDQTSAIKFSSPCGLNPESRLISKTSVNTIEPSKEFISNLLFISSTVINGSKIRIDGSLSSLTTMGSQLVLLLNQISQSSIYFSENSIIDSVKSGSWSLAELEGKLIHVFKYLNDDIHDASDLILSSALALRVSSIKLLIRISRTRKIKGKRAAQNLYRNAIFSRHYLITRIRFSFFLDHLFYLAFLLNFDILVSSIVSVVDRLGMMKNIHPDYT
jgi:glycosyltransferase involved in cell wall biosynthesis